MKECLNLTEDQFISTNSLYDLARIILARNYFEIETVMSQSQNEEQEEQDCRLIFLPRTPILINIHTLRHAIQLTVNNLSLMDRQFASKEFALILIS